MKLGAVGDVPGADVLSLLFRHFGSLGVDVTNTIPRVSSPCDRAVRLHDMEVGATGPPQSALFTWCPQ